MGGIIAGLVLALIIWLFSLAETDATTYVVGVVFDISIFTFVSCLFFKNNFVGEMVLEIISWENLKNIQFSRYKI